MITHWVKNGVPISGDELSETIARMVGGQLFGPSTPALGGAIECDDPPVDDRVFTAMVGTDATVMMVVSSDGVWIAGHEAAVKRPSWIARMLSRGQ